MLRQISTQGDKGRLKRPIKIPIKKLINKSSHT